MNSGRRKSIQLAGAAAIGLLCVSSEAGSQQPDNAAKAEPRIVLAGSSTDLEKIGFKIREFEKYDEMGYEVTFAQELHCPPVVLASSMTFGRYVAIQSVNKSGFRTTGWQVFRDAPLARKVHFAFVVILS